MTEPPPISVVTMGWRNERHAAAFISSLAVASGRAGPPASELIFVVNGPEGSAAATVAADVARTEQLPMTIVDLETNTGFSGGANAGVSRASGEIVVVANLDLTFDENFVEVLRREAGGAWDLLAPNVAQGDAGKDAGVSVRTPSHRLAWRSPAPSLPSPVPGGNGSCLVLRRSTIARREEGLGALFDAEYHSFNEDIDLFWWAARQGLVIRYVPDLRVTHLLAGSFAGSHRFRDRPPDIQRRVMANYRVTVWKNAASLRDWIGWPVGEALYGGQAVVFGGLAGLRRYAASWPESIRTSVAIRRRRGRLRPPVGGPPLSRSL